MYAMRQTDGNYEVYDLRDVTVGRIILAAEGEADGGLMALARFMLGAKGVTLDAPSSPAGWYWTATVNAPGRWEKSGPFDSYELAFADLRANYKPEV